MRTPRLFVRFAGNLLIVASFVGLLVLGALMLLPEQTVDAGQQAQGGSPAEQVVVLVRTGLAAAHAPTPRLNSPAPTTAQPNAAAIAPTRPITHLDVPSIGLSVDVVTSSLIERDGGLTWEVPAFKVGHAEGTAGAGQRGNAVLLGHVTSLRSGNVFADLERVLPGDAIRITADADQFEYRTVSKTAAPRNDTSVLEQDDTPSVSLVTCTGVWLPTIWDYTERLVVRAQLVDSR